MIRKNILAIALLGVFGLSHAADVENLRTISYLNEPLRLHADVVGEGDIVLAAPTEYLRLNHPIPNYDLSIDIIEENGKRQLVLMTTEEIESPALTLLLESRDANDRRQLFELPILLDFQPEPAAEVATNSASEIVIDGVTVDASADVVETTAEVKLEDIPEVAKAAVAAAPEKVQAAVAQNKAEAPKVVAKAQAAEPKAEVATVAAPPKVEAVKAKVEEKKADVVAATTQASEEKLIKRYGPVAKGETLWSIANKVRPANMTPQKMIELIKANNPSAFTSAGVLRANVTLLIPSETKPVQHKLVKSSQDKDNNSDLRIGFIYELPEPPVTAVVEQAEDVPVKVVVPVASQESTETAPQQDFTTISPEDSAAATPDTLVVDVPAVDLQPAVEEVVAPTEPEVVKPILVEATQPTPAEIVKDEVTVAAEAAALAKANEAAATPAAVEKAPEPPKRPIYMLPEPEPEPGIIELIFENIMYIGAGALVLILALLAIVMRRRKKDDEPKPAKEPKVKAEKPAKAKKKGSSLFGKKKDESVVESEPKVEAKKAKGMFGKKKAEAPVAPVQPAPTIAPVAAAATAAAVAPVVAASVKEPEAPKEDPTTIESLDFDLSFDVSEPVVAEVVSEPIDETATMDGLDFSLPEVEPVVEAVSSVAEVEPQSSDEYDALDFSLSFGDDDLGAIAEPTLEKTTDTEAFDGLDFDLSVFETPAATEEAAVESLDSFDYGESLDFDLGSLAAPSETTVELEPAPAVLAEPEPVVAVESIESVDDSGFGENNPLFSSQHDTGNAIETIAALEEDPTAEPSEYISFPDLLDNAEVTLAQDDVDADKPLDFGSFIEDEEAGLANLIETSKSTNNDPKLDLSFVADTSEDEEGLAFLDSLDFADEQTHMGDPIDHSVRDNVAKSTESVEALNAVEAPELMDLPEVTEPEPEIAEVVEVQTPTINFDLPEIVEPVVETSEVTLNLSDVDLSSFAVEPEVKVAEPIVEAPTLIEPEVILPEIVEEVVSPIVEPIIEPVVIEKEEIVSAPVVEETVQEVVIPTETTEVNDADFESEQVKLELAIAYMDFDKSLAKPLLDEVVRDGSPKQIERAQSLLSQID